MKRPANSEIFNEEHSSKKHKATSLRAARNNSEKSPACGGGKDGGAGSIIPDTPSTQKDTQRKKKTPRSSGGGGGSSASGGGEGVPTSGDDGDHAGSGAEKCRARKRVQGQYGMRHWVYASDVEAFEADLKKIPRKMNADGRSIKGFARTSRFKKELKQDKNICRESQ